MLKALIAINLSFLFFQKDLEYQLINSVISDASESSISLEFLSNDLNDFKSYRDYSVSFERDLLDPSKEFNLDSLFSKNQRDDFEKSLSKKPIGKIDLKRIENKSAINSNSKELNGFRQISYPIIQEGKNNNYYGIIIIQTVGKFGLSGESTINLYVLNNGKWEYVYSSVLSIT